jgi:hypothetical protein
MACADDGSRRLEVRVGLCELNNAPTPSQEGHPTLKRFHSSVLTALATTTVLLGLSPGRATAGLVVSFDSTSHVFSGTTPGATGPWAEAIFTRLGDHKVEVEFTISSNAVPGLYLDDAGFQFNTGTAPSFAHVSGVTASGTSFTSSGIAVPGTGNEKFDTNFGFPNGASQRVTFGKDSVYDITFSSNSPVLAGDLSNLFKMPDASGHNYFAAVHLAGYNGQSAGISGHIASVPEPATLLMFCLGISGLASADAYRRRRTRRGTAQLAEPLG